MKRYFYPMVALAVFSATNCFSQDKAVAKPYVPSPVLKDFYKVDGLPKQIEIYNNSIAQYPDTGSSANISYNFARISIASSYAKDGDKAAAETWLRKIPILTYYNTGVLGVASELNKRGDSEYADRALKPIVDSLYQIYTKTGKEKKLYNDNIVVYVQTLQNNKQPGKIVQYLKPLYEGSERAFGSDLTSIALTKPADYKLENNLSVIYARALAETGNAKEAVKVLSLLNLSGLVDAKELKDAIKAEYTKIPGGQKFYTQYVDSVRKVYNDKLTAFALYKKDEQGKPIDFKALKGKYVLLDFWGSWCGPCRASHPHLKELYNKYKDKGFEIVGIAQEKSDQAEHRQLWKQAIAEDGLTWTQVLDNENQAKFSVVSQYGVTAFPTKILLDKEGNIIGRYIGNGNGGSAFTAKLEAIFK